MYAGIFNNSYIKFLPNSYHTMRYLVSKFLSLVSPFVKMIENLTQYFSCLIEKIHQKLHSDNGIMFIVAHVS
jgi:hypothetical protein